MVITAVFEEQHTGPRFEWSESIVSVRVTPGSEMTLVSEAERPSDTEPVRAMYARLARAHAAEPTVPDRGGGVSGDKYSL